MLINQNQFIHLCQFINKNLHFRNPFIIRNLFIVKHLCHYCRFMFDYQLIDEVDEIFHLVIYRMLNTIDHNVFQVYLALPLNIQFNNNIVHLCLFNQLLRNESLN